MIKKGYADIFIDFWYEENITYIIISNEIYDKETKKKISKILDY